MKRKKFLQIVELSWVMQTWVLKTTLLRKMGSRNTTFPTWNGEFQVGITHSYRSTTPSHQPPSSLWNFWTLKYFLLIYFISKKSLSHLYGASDIRMVIA